MDTKSIFSWALIVGANEYVVTVCSDGLCLYYDELRFRRDNGFTGLVMPSCAGWKDYMAVRHITFDSYYLIRDCAAALTGSDKSTFGEDATRIINAILSNALKTPPSVRDVNSLCALPSVPPFFSESVTVA